MGLAARFLLAFPDVALERRFFAEHVQSDAHYQTAGFALYILTGAYVVYLGVGLGLHAYYGLRCVSSLPSFAPYLSLF